LPRARRAAAEHPFTVQTSTRAPTEATLLGVNGVTGNDETGLYYIIFDVDIHDGPRYRTYMEHVRPALEAAGGRYLVRGGEFTVYEGSWTPSRLVVLEFPSRAAWESFYYGPEYSGIRTDREEASSGRMVGVDGLAPGS
jgi:uncharacterized protein (DUF1330 family)